MKASTCAEVRSLGAITANHHGLRSTKSESWGGKERGDSGKRGEGLYLEALVGGRQRF